MPAVSGFYSSRPDPVVIDYCFTGDRSASAIARGESQLYGVVISGPSIPLTRIDCDVSAALREIGDRPRLYRDALLARTIESRYGVPRSTAFDDFHTASRLLDCAGYTARPPRESDDQRDVAELDPQHELQRFAHLAHQLVTAGLDYVYREIELPLIDVVADMIVAGVGVDCELLETLSHAYATERDILRLQLAEMVDPEWNPDSDEEVRGYLFGQRGLPVHYTTASGQPSVRDATLNQLADHCAVIEPLRAYRHHRRLVEQTESLREFRSPESGRLHPDVEPLGTQTGRFACSSPNVQQLAIPLRHIVRAADGHQLIEVDVSQAELRVLAHYTQDPLLLEAFRNENVDLHRRTASLILHKPEDAVTTDERNRLGKSINFAILYGTTEYGLAERLGISPGEAAQLVAGFRAGYPEVERWIERVKRQASCERSVRTFTGRLRSLPDIGLPDAKIARRAERQAVNTIIQGTAADLFKIAILRLHQELPRGSHLILTVHDSALIETPDEQVNEVVELARTAFESPIPGFSVPIRVDIHRQPHWGG